MTDLSIIGCGVFSASFVTISTEDQDSLSTPVKPLSSLDRLENEDTSHKFMMKQASVLMVEAACRNLHHCVVAIQDLTNTYIRHLKELTGIFDMTVDKLPVAYTNQEIYDKLVDLRCKIKKERESLTELRILFNYVKKLMDSAAETSFLVGAEFSSILASERLSTGEKVVGQVMLEVERAEWELKKAEAAHIQRVGKMATKDSDKLDEKTLLNEVERLGEPPMITPDEDIKVSVFETDQSNVEEKRVFTFDHNSDDTTKVTVKFEESDDIKISIKEEDFSPTEPENEDYDDSKELLESIRAPDLEEGSYKMPTY